MVAVHEQRRELAVVQLLQPLLLALIAVLDTAEVPADNNVVVLRHLTLYREAALLKPAEIRMAVAGYIDHCRHLLLCVSGPGCCAQRPAGLRIVGYDSLSFSSHS